MSARTILLTILFLILITAGGYMFLLQGKQKLAQTAPSPTTASSPSPTTASSQSSIPNSTTVTSKDGRGQFMYPKTWKLQETTNPKGGNGQFGKIVQSWVLTSFASGSAGQGGIPQNAAKIDMEIMQGGKNMPIDELVDCSGKKVSCEKIGIDNEQFIKATSVLNTGMIVITVATFYDDKVLRASGLIETGKDQEENRKTVEAIFNSIHFVNPR